MSALQQFAPEWDVLALEVGKFMRYWGFKVIHGRIWTHIYLSDTPLDARALMERFGLSKALMSLSLNDLLKHNVILEGPKSDRGTQTYVANFEVLNVILNVLKSREREILTQIKTAHEMLSALPQHDLEKMQINVERLERLGQMIHKAQETLEAMIELANLDFKEWTFLNKKT